MPSVSALSRWLQFVAILRVFSVVLGYFYPDTLAANLYNGDSAQVSELQARTFATWTLTSCMLCLLCARNPSVVPIYSATLGSFLIALLHFSIEVFVYKTVSVKSAIQPMVVASISSLWMGAGWNYYTSYVSSAPAVSEETQVTHTDKTD
ncbi:Ergosterol biosynthetic protein 28 [Picochlorum sp. SENEW3]|nr:Ergosterol biosynthetic protein 28 [Picochlorum sp. SENEW3]WPT14876.1 Ergosterol biosynthetic protein 28 [Picochlorum sp. SENEW3]